MRLPPPAEVVPAADLGRVHLIGIGGAGLSGIARILLARGMPVSGSDGVDSATLDALRELGATVWVGHHADQLGAADTVVVSTAIREDNPEYLEAVRRGLRILPRSAAVASILAGRRAIAVAGTHGKTTTTSLLTVALQAAGGDPAYAIGGDLTATGVNAGEGAGEFVIEADESDGAFLEYAPFAAAVTNVDADHLDQWGDEASYREAFERFVDTLDLGGFVVLCADDPGARALADPARSRGLDTYLVGTDPAADVVVSGIETKGGRSSFDVADGGVGLGRISLQIPGRHYVLDAALALTTGLRLGHPFEGLRRGLEDFTGTRRRMELKGEAGGVRVYDSYAHHPTEIVGDLEAARSLAGTGRVIVGFQPHLVSRTRVFGDQMGRALGAADEVVVLDIYLAREEPDPRVTGAAVADAVPLPRDAVEFVPDLADAPRALAGRARPGDLVLTLGAGTVTEVGPLVLALLAADASEVSR